MPGTSAQHLRWCGSAAGWSVVYSVACHRITNHDYGVAVLRSTVALNLTQAADPLLRSELFLGFGDTVFQPPLFHVVLTAFS